MKGVDTEALRAVPVFPLPDYVLFPYTLIPFHIFEPRYRRMLADSLAGSRLLVVAGLRPGWEGEYYGSPPVYEVAGLGKIAADERLPDGRYNVVVHGLARVRVAEWLQHDPYRVARVEPIEDRIDTVVPDELSESLRAMVGELALRIGVSGGPLARVLATTKEAAPLTYRLASMLVADARLRQAILEERSPTRRADLIVDEVARALLDTQSRHASDHDALPN